MEARTNECWRDYDRGAARINERAEAIDADALTSARRIREPVTSRSDIFNAFDYITYQKGATVIGMYRNDPGLTLDGFVKIDMGDPRNIDTAVKQLLAR